MSLGEGAYEALLAILAANPGQARRLAFEHRLDATGHCRACRYSVGCTLGSVSRQVLRKHGVTGG